MPTEKILNQDEIDALIHGIDVGAVSTEPEPAPGEVRAYDFKNQMRIVRGRMPTLEMINERFARLFRVSLYNLLRRSPEISVVAGDDEEIQRVRAHPARADEPQPREDQSAARHCA